MPSRRLRDYLPHPLAGAILAAALIATDSPPVLPRGTAASRPSGPPADPSAARKQEKEPSRGRHSQLDRTPARGHEQGRRPASGSAGGAAGDQSPARAPGALAAAAVALACCRRG